MSKNHRNTSRLMATLIALLLTTSGLMAQQKALLFGDTFNRADSTNLNESATGKSGSLGALDYGWQTNSTLRFDIYNNTLGVQNDGGDGTYGGIVYPLHNFTDEVITNTGTFSVTVDIAKYTTGGSGRWMSIGVGQSLSELQAVTNDLNATALPADLLVGYRNTTDTLAIYNNGTLNESESVTGGLPDAPTTMRVEYSSITDFNAGSNVTYEVFFDDATTAFTSGSFTWSGADENYVSLSANMYGESRFDNFAIRSGSTAGDVTDPTPSPMTWASVPAADNSSTISMTATNAYDDNGVEYNFECTVGGGPDSDWQSGTSYTATNLTPGTTYTYTVTARDLSENQNVTDPSIAESVTTPALDDMAPNPDPMTWALVPAADSHAAISMTATTATDAEGNGVEYFFTSITGGGSDSGWQTSPEYTDFGLDAETAYSYAVKARDNSPDGFNETANSTTNSATTDAPPTTIRIAGVDFEDADGTTWNSAPDDLNASDGITVSADWTVVGSDANTVIKQDNGGEVAAEFGFDGATPGVGETARTGKLNMADSGGPAAPPATTYEDYFSWSITIPAGEELDLASISFKWRQGTGTASQSRWGQFNTSLDGGPDGGTPLWSLADPVVRPNWEDITVDLSAAKYQNLTDTTVTFYWYTERTGADIETIIVNAFGENTPTDVSDVTIDLTGGGGTNANFSWYGESGGTYILQSREHLTSGDWTNITSVAGADAIIIETDEMDKDQKFYRVKLAD